MSATDQQITSAASLVALEATTIAGRIPAALQAISDASGPLKASNGNSGGGDVSDPTFAALGVRDDDRGTTVRDRDTASRDRRTIDRLIRRLLDDTGQVARILNGWAPDEDRQRAIRGSKATNDTIWCPNHRQHGIDTPKTPGRSLCDFCDQFRRDHKDPNSGQGLLPNRWLLDVHARRRVNSADLAHAVKQILVENADAKRAKKAARKAKADA